MNRRIRRDELKNSPSAQAYAYAGREDVARLVHGGVGNLLKRRFFTPVITA